MEVKRKLASVQRILEVIPIEGADNIELVRVLGWQCVAKKGEFAAGHLCVYFEIDSQLPVHEVFEFMEPRKFRVKTAKFMKNISQGLALPLNITQKMGFNQYLNEGDDITEMLGVTKYEPRPQNSNPESTRKISPIRKALMKFAVYRAIDRFIFPARTKGNFPDFVQKTDETRLQSVPLVLKRSAGKQVYITEKLDGSSSTYFYNRELSGKKFGIFKKDHGNGFGVCSRNLRLVHEDNSYWWRIAKLADLQRKVKEASRMLDRSLAIQGEIIGPDIQKNKYGLTELDFFCYSIFDIDNQVYLSRNLKDHICFEFDIKHVPLVEQFPLNDEHTIEWFIDLATRKSVVGKKPLAEGIVVREVDDESVSFKVISPKWLLKNDE